jgi:tetratricopeptide (TPR) repeat protein
MREVDVIETEGLSVAQIKEAIGRVYNGSGADAAALALKRAINRDPTHSGLAEIAATLLFELERWELSATIARWATILGPGTPDAQLRAAAYCFRAREYTQSVFHTDRAHEQAPGEAAPLFMKGRALVALGWVDQGMCLISEAARVNPKYRFAHRVMGFALTSRDFERVRRAIPGTLRQSPEEPDDTNVC